MLLMPSEVARLVYGYLLETKCEKTATTFLEESACLKEFAEGVRDGKKYSTTINKKSLLQMLEEKSEYHKDNVNSKAVSSFKAITCLNRIKEDICELSNIFNENKFSSEDTNDRSPSKNSLPQQNSAKNTLSPRRKNTTPKRIVPLQQEKATVSQCIPSNSDANLPVPSSSLSELSSQTQKEGTDYVVNKKLMVEELLNCKPLQEKLANQINNKIATEYKKNLKSNIANDESTESVTSKRSSELVVGNIEKDLLPSDILDEIIKSIFDEPELDELIETVIVKDNPEFQHTNLSALETQTDASQLKNLPIDLTLLGKKDAIQTAKTGQVQQQQRSRNIEEIAKTQLRSNSTNKGAHLSNFKFKVLRNKQLQVQQTRNKATPFDDSSTNRIDKIQLPIKSAQTPIQLIKLSSANPVAISNVINLTTCVQPNLLLSSQNITSLQAKPSNQPILLLNSHLNQQTIPSITNSNTIQSISTSTPVFSGKRKADESLIQSAKIPATNSSKDTKIKTLLNTNLDKFLSNIHKSSNEASKKS